jgi:hypothetical protein
MNVLNPVLAQVCKLAKKASISASFFISCNVRTHHRSASVWAV